MNTNGLPSEPESQIAPTPEWGADEATSLRAVRTTKDPARLTQMAEDIMAGRVFDDGVVSDELLFNRYVPFEAACRLAEHWRGVNDFGYQLCIRPDATPEVLDSWSGHWDNVVIEEIAAHPNTSLGTLMKMSQSESPRVVARAIANPRFPQELLGSFSEYVPGVREVVAARIEDLSILEKLAFDECSEVRGAAMENPHTPAALANRVARADGDMRVVAKAAAKVDDSAVLDELAEKGTKADQDLIRAILKNPHSSDVAKTWAVLIR
jgi:hypothetical protein